MTRRLFGQNTRGFATCPNGRPTKSPPNMTPWWTRLGLWQFFWRSLPTVRPIILVAAVAVALSLRQFRAIPKADDDTFCQFAAFATGDLII